MNDYCSIVFLLQLDYFLHLCSFYFEHFSHVPTDHLGFTQLVTEKVKEYAIKILSKKKKKKK